jgi:tetraacyldisaccharide 4'-kinase
VENGLSLTNSIKELKSTIQHGGSPPAYLYPLFKAGTLVQQFGMFLRLRALEHEVEAHVISVGNITAGGSGKTPAVIGIAKECIQKGDTVGILTRGYGVPQVSDVVVSKDVPQNEWPQRLGDEPALILSKVPEATLFKGKNRILSAQTAIDDYHCSVLLLDDGFQYVQLKRDKNIVLIDATNPFGNGNLIPLGVLREPLSELTRATEIWITRCDQASSTELEELTASLKKVAEDARLVKKFHRPTRLRQLSTGKQFPLDWLNAKPVHAVCALGNPQSFFDTLVSLGAELLSSAKYDDHEKIPELDTQKVDAVIVTEKDAVKLSDVPENVYALEIEMADFNA